MGLPPGPDRAIVAGATMKPLPIVKCPTCKREGDWLAGKYGPFCSHRCKLVDLGKWFDEELRISEPLRPEHLQKEMEDLDLSPKGLSNLPAGGESDPGSDGRRSERRSLAMLACKGWLVI